MYTKFTVKEYFLRLLAFKTFALWIILFAVQIRSHGEHMHLINLIIKKISNLFMLMENRRKHSPKWEKYIYERWSNDRFYRRKKHMYEREREGVQNISSARFFV